MNSIKHRSVRQSDVRRIVRAVHAEGLIPRAIRVATSGEVSIDMADMIAPQVDPLEEWRGRQVATSQRR